MSRVSAGNTKLCLTPVTTWAIYHPQDVTNPSILVASKRMVFAAYR